MSVKHPIKNLSPDFRPCIIESPYAGDLDANEAYLRALKAYCVLELRYSPYASHGMLTDTFDDHNPQERALGIDAGLAFHRTLLAAGIHGGPVIVGVDRGISPGMRKGIAYARLCFLAVHPVSIYDRIRSGDVNEDRVAFLGWGIGYRDHNPSAGPLALRDVERPPLDYTELEKMLDGDG